jgi:hypothetical protein
MGIKNRLKPKKKDSQKKERYYKKDGETAEKHLSKGYAVSTLPAALKQPMEKIEQWIEEQPHFKQCIEYGLAKQEMTLTQMGMKIALKNEGNYKAWSALCRVKLGWKMETDPDSGDGKSDQPIEINIFREDEER